MKETVSNAPKTHWDYIDLIIKGLVPLALAVGTIIITINQSRIADENSQAEIMTNYINHISELLVKENMLEDTKNQKRLEQIKRLRIIGQARTLTALARLDGKRKGEIVKFLYAQGLIGGCKLDPKTLEPAKKCDEGFLKLTDANLTQTETLKSFIIPGANLNSSNLSEANIQGADLTKASLEEAILRGANLKGAILSGANFKKAQLNGANLEGAILTGANLEGAILTDTYFNSAILDGANFKKARLIGADLQKACLINSDLSGANIDKANLNGSFYNKDTEFPSGFDPSKKKMQNIETCPELLSEEQNKVN